MRPLSIAGVHLMLAFAGCLAASPLTHADPASAGTTDADAVPGPDGGERSREVVGAQTPGAQLLYNTVERHGVTTNAGTTVYATEQGQIILEVSLLATGKGAEFRSWIPESARLVLGETTLKPTTSEPYYIEKESAVANLATAIFAMVGASAADAKRAEASKGSACQASGGSAGGHDRTRSRFGKAIDHIGTAAGMAGLATQMKGQLEGLRVVFDVTHHAGQLNSAMIVARLVNSDPARINVSNAPREFQAKIPAPFEPDQSLIVLVKPTIIREIGE